MRTLLPDEPEVIERILRHVDEKTTDRAVECWREPVENYVSEKRLAAEQKEVLRRFPAVFCPSSALPAPGDYATRCAAGTSLLVVRGQDGIVRGFRNACRHRGMRLAAQAGTAKAFVCPYHGWTYGTDGALLSVPHDDGFPELDKSARGLHTVHVEERHGLIWVRQRGPKPSDPLQALEEPLKALGLADLTMFGHEEAELSVNWKLLIEGYLEGYHIRVTHRESFYPYGFDNLNVSDTFGHHSRVIFPFRRIETLKDLPREEWHLDRMGTFVYHLFPNVIVAGLSYHIQVLVFEPVSPGVTRWHSYRLAEPDVLANEREKIDRDLLFAEVGNREDVEVGEGVQSGLESGANAFHEFGQFEGAISHFHRGLDAALQ